MQWKELTSEDFTLQLQKHNNEKVESLLLFTFLQAPSITLNCGGSLENGPIPVFSLFYFHSF